MSQLPPTRFRAMIKRGLLLSLAIFLSFMAYFFTPVSSEKLLSVDYILVEKEKRIMKVFHKNKMQKEYRVALGFSPQGPKENVGDGKTPEGSYLISQKNPQSRYHLSLKISYPNAQDLQRSKTKMGALGGDIMIHGLRNDLAWIGRFHVLRDWTLGCIAVTNAEIEELYAAVPVGTRVDIRP